MKNICLMKGTGNSALQKAIAIDQPDPRGNLLSFELFIIIVLFNVGTDCFPKTLPTVSPIPRALLQGDLAIPASRGEV